MSPERPSGLDSGPRRGRRHGRQAAAHRHGLKVGIGDVAVFADIEPLKLFFFAHPQAHRGLDDTEHDEGKGEGEDADADDADQLTDELGAAGQAAKDADGQGAPYAGHQVDRYGSDRIVDLDLIEEQHRKDHDGAGDQADDDGRQGRHLIGAGGNADQPGQNPVQGH